MNLTWKVKECCSELKPNIDNINTMVSECNEKKKKKTFFQKVRKKKKEKKKPKVDYLSVKAIIVEVIRVWNWKILGTCWSLCENGYWRKIDD